MAKISIAKDKEKGKGKKKELPVELYLKEIGEGGVALMMVDQEGGKLLSHVDWVIAILRPEGTLILAPSLPDGYGLRLTDIGEIVTE